MQWNAVIYTHVIDQLEIKVIVLIEINHFQWDFEDFVLEPIIIPDYEISMSVIVVPFNAVQ